MKKIKQNKLKIAKRTLKSLILELSVDEDGNKISDRVLWSKPEFMDKTGLYKINEYTKEKEMASLGTVSYYKKILGVSAEEVFKYHQYVTCKIDPLVLFEEWNLRTATKSIKSGSLSEKSRKTKLIKDFELSSSMYSTYTLKELENSIIELFDLLGDDGKKVLREYYKGGK